MYFTFGIFSVKSECFCRKVDELLFISVSGLRIGVNMGFRMIFKLIICH